MISRGVRVRRNGSTPLNHGALDGNPDRSPEGPTVRDRTVMNDRKQVRVVPYDEAWREAFRTEHDALTAALGPTCLAIRHVGSTSVPGLSAKPVIDILIETPGLALIDRAIPLLQHRGYEARGEYGIPGRSLTGTDPSVDLRVRWIEVACKSCTIR